jgi:hypothetical protein
VARFVGAKDVRDASESFDAPGGLAFIEAFLFKESAGPFDVVLDRQDGRAHLACLARRRRNQTCARDEQRTKTVRGARSRRPGYVIEGRERGINRCDMSGLAAMAARVLERVLS